MKILPANAIEDSWTYIPEMVDNFQKRGAHAIHFTATYPSSQAMATPNSSAGGNMGIRCPRAMAR
jgi:hypothetical protein